jgi:hypothetical protein
MYVLFQKSSKGIRRSLPFLNTSKNQEFIESNYSLFIKVLNIEYDLQK